MRYYPAATTGTCTYPRPFFDAFFFQVRPSPSPSLVRVVVVLWAVQISRKRDDGDVDEDETDDGGMFKFEVVARLREAWRGVAVEVKCALFVPRRAGPARGFDVE